jgi:hypothetical protein
MGGLIYAYGTIIKQYLTSDNARINKKLAMPNIFRLFRRKHEKWDTTKHFSDLKKDYYTPISEAIELARHRKSDHTLRARIEKSIRGDIPSHFSMTEPILYLSRHIATPNYETLRFIEIAKPYQLPLIIGQDRKAKFVSKNPTKRCLGKLSVVSGMTRYQDEILENFTVVNFNEVDGKPFTSIETIFKDNIVDFHNNLLHEVYPKEVTVVDEDAWVDSHFRGDLGKQYEEILSLCVVHGVLFESFPDDEIEFFNEIFVPAFDAVTKKFGHKPLVVEHISDEMELERDWNSYPSVIYPYLTRALETVNNHRLR